MKRLLNIIFLTLCICVCLWAGAGTNMYECGSWIEIKATPIDGFSFVGWSDGDTASTRQIEVMQDAVFIAYFAEVCDEFANLPVVTEDDGRVLIDVATLQEQGYYLSPEHITWYRVVGVPDSLHTTFPDDDIEVCHGYQLVLKDDDNVSGSYYAVAELTDYAGKFCDGLFRSVLVQWTTTGLYTSSEVSPTAWKVWEKGCIYIILSNGRRYSLQGEEIK